MPGWVKSVLPSSSLLSQPGGQQASPTANSNARRFGIRSAATRASKKSSLISRRENRGNNHDSPDSHSICRREIEFLGGFHSVGVVPPVKVTHRLRPLPVRRVFVRHNLLSQRLVPHFFSPGLREGEEESLMPAQPLEYRQWLFAQGDFVGVVGRSQAGHVSNVFTERLLAVDMQT